MTLDRIYRLLGGAGIAFFITSAFTPLAHFLDKWTAPPSQIQPSDAIVVLGAAVSRGGILSAESVLRTDRGIALYQQGLAPLIVFLGRGEEGGPTEADARATIARLKGIPPEAILTEPRAHTTREEALLVKALLQPRGVRTILLVTNSAHLLKARPLFERAGVEVRAALSDDFTDPGAPEQRLALMRSVVEELLGWAYYRIAGYL